MMVNSRKKYNLGFTSAAFLFRDSILLSQLFLKERDWKVVREKVLKDNLLQIRTIAAQKRIFSETYTRLLPLSNDALELIAEGMREDQVHVIWYAICKKYAIIKEFSEEVLSHKLRMNDRNFSESDFNIFYNNLANDHDELVQIAVSSKRKLATNLIRMLRSAGIVGEDDMLRPQSVSALVREIIETDRDVSLDIYPGAQI